MLNLLFLDVLSASQELVQHPLAPLAVSHLLTHEQHLLPGRESAGLVGWSADGPVIRAAGEGVADRNLLAVGEARARHALRLIASSPHRWSFSFDPQDLRAVLESNSAWRDL